MFGLKGMKKKGITLSDIAFIVVYVLLSFICLPGVTLFANYYLIWMLGVVVLLQVCRRRSNITTISKSLIIYILWIMCLIVSLIFSINVEQTMRYTLIYVFGFYLCTVNWSGKRMKGLITTFEIVCIVLLITQFISVVDNTFVIRYFSFLFGQGNIEIMLRDMRYGIYMGLAGERSEAAYIFVIGLVICLARMMPYIQNGRKTPRIHVILSILFLFGTMLTGKRMLFVVAVFNLALYMFFGKRGAEAKIKMMILFIGLFILMLVAVVVIPELNVVLRRFSENSGNVLNGREELWDYAFAMLDDNYYLGNGYGTYNTYVQEVFAYDWNYHAHCVYIQILAEMGIVGFVVWAALVTTVMFDTIKLIRKNRLLGTDDECTLIWFSLGVQVVTLIYGISGNVLYYPRQLALYLVAVALVYMLKKKARENQDV